MLLRDRTRFEEPHRYLGEDSGDDVSVDRSKNLATYFASVIGYMDDNGNVTFEFIEEPSRWQKWRGKIPERLRSTINLASGTRSVAEIQTDLQAISMDVFDIDLAALSRYKPDIRGQIIIRSEEHTSELQSRGHLVCRLLLEKKNKTQQEDRDRH